MKKKNIADSYLSQKPTSKWDIAFGLLIAVGVIVLIFAYGWGYLGIPIIFVGAAGLIISRSQRVSDEDYEKELGRILADNKIDTSAGGDEVVLASYLLKDRRTTVGSDKKTRSDTYVIAKFLPSKDTCRIHTYEVNITAHSVEKMTCTVSLSTPPELALESVNTPGGVKKQGFIRFDGDVYIPTDPNSADTDALISRLGRK